jgi:SAM-dependent methyltransferase
MSDTNDKTVQSYEEHVQEYIAGTPQDVSGDVKDWIDRALSHVDKSGTILEIGSAFGRDATYIESKGYRVDRTDATKAFVELLNKQGHTARVLNAITDDFGGPYAMVIANAVFLHFKPDEAKQALRNAYKALQPNGIFAFTVKEGNGEEWTDDKLGSPRYFVTGSLINCGS